MRSKKLRLSCEFPQIVSFEALQCQILTQGLITVSKELEIVLCLFKREQSLKQLIVGTRFMQIVHVISWEQSCEGSPACSRLPQDVSAGFASARATWVVRKKVLELWPVQNRHCRHACQRMVVGTDVVLSVTGINRWFCTR